MMRVPFKNAPRIAPKSKSAMPKEVISSLPKVLQDCMRGSSSDERRSDVKQWEKNIPGLYHIAIAFVSDDKHESKFLGRFPHQFTVRQLMQVVRNRFNVKPQDALVCICHYPNGSMLLPLVSASLESICDGLKWNDGILYITIRKENTFG
jgi:hypothetical protein